MQRTHCVRGDLKREPMLQSWATNPACSIIKEVIPCAFGN